MILITGATDAVGGALLADLCGQAQPVRAVVATPEQGDALRGYDCEVVVVGDGDTDAVDAALRSVSGLALLASPNGRPTPVEQLLLRRAGEDAGPRVLALGGRADSEPGSGRSGWTTLVPAPYFQDFLDQAGRIQTAGKVTGPPAGTRAAYVDARDVAGVARHVLTSDGHHGATYTVTGPEALSGEDLASCFAAALGRDVGYTPGTAAVLGAVAEPTEEVRKATGRAPRSLRDFVTEHAAAFR